MASRMRPPKRWRRPRCAPASGVGGSGVSRIRGTGGPRSRLSGRAARVRALGFPRRLRRCRAPRTSAAVSDRGISQRDQPAHRAVPEGTLGARRGASLHRVRRTHASFTDLAETPRGSGAPRCGRDHGFGTSQGRRANLASRRLRGLQGGLVAHWAVPRTARG